MEVCLGVSPADLSVDFSHVHLNVRDLGWQQMEAEVSSILLSIEDNRVAKDSNQVMNEIANVKELIY